MVLSSQLDNYKLIYNAEIDGIDPRQSHSEDLCDLSFIEAKLKQNQARNMTKLWAQCYLAGVDTAVIGRWGRRVDFVDRIEIMNPEKFRPKNAAARLQRLKAFLDHVKVITKDANDPSVVWNVTVHKNGIDSSLVNSRPFLLEEFVESFVA